MDFFEGYNYRINIIGADSSIIVDSNTGLIRGCVADHEENIIVDTATKTFHGTLNGNIVDSKYNIVLDTNKNEINISNINSETIKGNIVNSKNEIVYNSFHNTISNVDFIKTNSLDTKTFFSEVIKGNIFNNRDEVVYNYFHNTFENIGHIKSFSISANEIDSENYSGNFCGNILNRDGKILFDFENNTLDLSSVFEEILYSRENLRFNCSKKFSFATPIADLINNNNKENYQNFNFSQISVINENTFDDKDLAGMVGFFGTETNDETINRDMFFGSIGFIVNCSAELKNNILSKNLNNNEDSVSLIPTDFVVINGQNNYNLLDYERGYEFVDNNALVFNADGVLSAPVIKTGVHKDLSKIAKPAKGMIIFNDNINKFQGYTGTEWVDLH